MMAMITMPVQETVYFRIINASFGPNKRRSRKVPVPLK
jgi:hypothetical protein